MFRALACLSLTALLSAAAAAQSAAAGPAFEIADVHTSPRSTSSRMRTSMYGGRYELTNASMVDLVRTAYTVDAGKIVGGPAWLEYDRFDVIAKVPPNTPQATLKEMLQSLLAERFKLVVREDTQLVAGFVLSKGKGKPKLKEADGKGDTGCKNQPLTLQPGAAQPIRMRVISCQNTTMQAFAAALRGLAGAYIDSDVVDSTELKGAWDFDLNWALIPVAGSDGISIFDAVDKQLGLKLEEQKIPTPVLVVEKVNEKPTANPPDLAAKLPAPPAEFEVADIKPVMPGTVSTGVVFSGVQPGGRVNLSGAVFTLKSMIGLAWNVSGTDVAGPKWLDSARYDIIAKVPEAFAPAATSLNDVAPMLRALFIDRFKMKSHFEDRPVDAYTLVSAKPKLRKADPAARTGCREKTGAGTAVAGEGFLPGSPRQLVCQNITMAQFADQLQIFAGSYIHYPVVDGTGLEGAWDFTLSFSPIPPSQLAGSRGANPFGTPNAGGAADPVGGTTIFDAVEKQLGLKLEIRKRPYPSFVIDHIEEKPTDN